MTKPETRMTRESRMNNDQSDHSAFWHWAFSRHSSFIIRHSLCVLLGLSCVAAAPATRPAAGEITAIEPAEKGFFTKQLEYDGIPIKAPAVVVDDALFEARNRLETLMGKLPVVRANLRDARAELHIIGREQGTSDLPEWQHMKGKLFEGKLTIDQRTRGMGGRMVSCGEENLLRLEKDRYRGRDICLHEFSHCIFQYGAGEAVRKKFREQRESSLAAGLWVDSYAGSNVDEFFAELTMWYFGTHGDMGMKGTKPKNGPDGLRAYDAQAFTLMDDFYSGKMDVPRIERKRDVKK